MLILKRYRETNKLLFALDLTLYRFMNSNPSSIIDLNISRPRHQMSTFPTLMNLTFSPTQEKLSRSTSRICISGEIRLDFNPKVSQIVKSICRTFNSQKKIISSLEEAIYLCILYGH